MVACRVLGHHFRFRAEGSTMHWECTRGCGAGGSKTYATSEQATLYARGLEHDDPAAREGRAPLISMLPLRLMRRLRRPRRAG